ncbi:long-chain-alcohol oxidase FAO4A-like isoform X2 [Magnolia sinica]|uniref:long-chain-alcohol oxidase FAO4A-like isoform X2 n=1 Tax=Magnolia sinica TaxID=86752 RepID=UPI0026583ABD|nr:long-chain-alcohol oxidase FAO4A-like isoform X2 [Magnolia sinica]
MDYIHAPTSSFSSSTRKVGDDSSIDLNLEQMAAISKIVSDGMGSHWLLRGGRPPYVNHLSRRKMATLTAICDTLLQSIDVSSSTEDESLQMFFHASSSANGTPQHADEKNENPSWKAIGYCGPDPDFINQRRQAQLPEEEGTKQGEEAEAERLGPLHRALVDMENPKGIILENLQKAGFTVSVHNCKGKNPSPLSPLTISCDAVVVGSGSGGGVVAGVLAKAGYKVVVLEKGNYFARCNLSLLEGPSADQMYEGGGMVATENLSALFLAGSTVGGGSAINWSASLRTPDHVIREWSNEYDLELFGSKAYKQALDAVCERMGVQSEVENEGFNNAVLRKGCLEMGYPVSNIPRNSTSDHYCGWCHLGCKDGKKKGTQETWLVDLADSGNGVILPGCMALKVLHKSKKGRNVATGVVFEYINRRGMKDVYVVESKVTIVACGALRTPLLLKKSGLKNAHVGKHLHIHPTAMAWGYFPETSGWPEEGKKSYEGGIMTAMSTVVANFKTSGYGAVIQTPSLHPGMFAGVMPWISGLDIKERMTKFSRTAHIFALARDKGSGKVNYPKSLTYKLDDIDEENLQRGLEKMLRILAAAGAEEIGTHHCKGEILNVKQASSHEFERFVKRESRRRLKDLSTPICSAHQMGSCRMGVSPKQSVVNQRGETWEVEGLFIADTSVFPTALGVNPMVTVQAIAYCTAQSIIEVLRRKKTIN